MSYRVVYSKDGHEMLSDRLDTISEVNEKIRALYDAMTGVAILGIEEDHDGPRTWQIVVEPEDVERVIGKHSGRTWTQSKDGFWDSPGCAARTWRQLLGDEGSVTEVVETEVEAAARRLREAGYISADSAVSLGSMARDVRTVLTHVLNGGTL